MRLAEMANYDLRIIFNNINRLIEAIGLKDASVAAMLEISTRKLEYIRSGKHHLNITDIESFAKFFDIKTNALSHEDLKIDFSLRDRLYRKYRKIPALGVHFETSPSISYAVKYIFEQRIHLEEAKEVSDIRTLLKERGWNYESSSISQALARLKDQVIRTAHPTKKGTFLYSRKKAV